MSESAPSARQQLETLREMQEAAGTLLRCDDALLAGQYAHLAGRIAALVEILEASGAGQDEEDRA
jgi:hypothetical protein